MASELKAREDIVRGFEIYNTGDPDAMDRWYDELLSPDCVYHNPGVGHPVIGREGIKQFVRGLYKHIPDMVHNPADDVFVQGDKVAVRYSVSRADPASGKRKTATILMINHYVGDRQAEIWEIVGPWEDDG
jgi:ketosteroid isomerase-like protein